MKKLNITEPMKSHTYERLTGNVFEHAEHFALWRHSLDVRVVLQSQQAAQGGSADVDQLKVAGEVRRWVFSGNDVPFKHGVPNVPQGAADVQAARFGWEVANKSYDVFCRNRPGTVLKTRYSNRRANKSVTISMGALSA